MTHLVLGNEKTEESEQVAQFWERYLPNQTVDERRNERQDSLSGRRYDLVERRPCLSTFISMYANERGTKRTHCISNDDVVAH
jgi:hypothetical protein